MACSHLRNRILIGSLASALLWAQPIAAQVIPDATLPAGERSQVTGNPNVQIDGGARRGGNLFHSFSQFSIPTGGSAFFNNAANVQNIFSRVTGGSLSNIDGLIRANGTANLFLLNPNGILFGPNASLNIGGSFVGTTANAIGFPNGEVFSSDATQPLPSQLLTVNPNAFFFNQLTPTSIVNQSTANNGTGLQVPAGQSLLLVGGNVRLEGGQITSPGSRVELGAVAGQGTVGLSGTGSDWRLSFPDNVVRADVSFSNSAGVNVRAGGGGSIAVTTGNLSLTEGSGLFVGINDGAGSVGAQAGDIQLDATEVINLAGGSQIRNNVRPGGTGNAGNTNITTGSLSITEGATLFSLTSGQGNTGSVNINARDTISLDGAVSAIANYVGATGIGNAGDINITTGSLLLTNLAQLVSLTFGQGNAGSVNINARNMVSLDGRDSNGFVSGIFNAVDETGVGNAGGINITTETFSLTGGAQLQSVTFGQGNTGSVNINARDTVALDNGTVFNVVTSTAVGNAGDINIATGSLSLTNAGQLTSYTMGRGNAGKVNINARDTVSLDGTDSNLFSAVYSPGIGNGGGINITTGSLTLTNDAGLTTTTRGQGDAGAVNINARDTVSLDESSNIATNVQDTAVGNAGDINITTGSLSLTNGSQLQSATLGQGNAGSVNINARDTVALDGYIDSPAGPFTSTIFTRVDSGAIGQGGDVTISAGSLSLTNGGSVTTANIGGVGNSGRVNIQARDSVEIRGAASINDVSEVVTLVRPGAVGQGGDVSITTGSLSVSDQGRINTRSEGEGNAGKIQIQASDSVSFDGGDAISRLEDGAVGRGGDIDITARSLSVLNNAQLAASTSGDGDAGNITVSADAVNLSSGGQLLTTTFGNGQAGDITVNTPDLQLSGTASGLFAQTTTAADAGDLTIQPRSNGQSVRVSLQDGAQISASTASSGRGGTLTIAAPEFITLTGNGSVIAAGTGDSGNGGNLILHTRNLNILNRAEVTVSSSGTGSAGNLFVDADRIFLNNQGRIRADTSGGGGNIEVRSPFILLRNGSNISTNATGANIAGGNIGIDTRFLIAVPNEDSNISANSEDFRGGNVRINAFSIFGIEPRPDPTSLSDITATGATSALPGTVDVVTAGLDPTAGLVALPRDFADSGLIAQGCPANAGNSFVITGRGGLPPTPEQQLDDDADWQDRRRLMTVKQADSRRASFRPNSQATAEHSTVIPHPSIVEATGWQVTATGDILLTAISPTPVVQNLPHQTITCSGEQSNKLLK